MNIFNKKNRYFFSELQLKYFEFKFLFAKKTDLKLLTFDKISRFKMLISYFRRGIFFDRIILDASNICQLKCPLCPNGGTGLVAKNAAGRGYLKYSDFKKFIDANNWIEEVELACWGEIFLNPELDQILEYADNRGVKVIAWIGANLNSATEKTLESVVKYKMRYLAVAIDGATNETYKIYRRGGDLEKVLNHIKKINEFKKKYNSIYPELVWRFVVFGHNEHEIPKAMEMAKVLNMSFKLVANYNPSYSSIKNKKELQEKYGFEPHSAYVMCQNLWLRPAINWDGKLLGCYANYWMDFGSAFEKGLDQVLISERYSYAKKMVLGLVPPRKDVPCFNCEYYKKQGKAFNFKSYIQFLKSNYKNIKY